MYDSGCKLASPWYIFTFEPLLNQLMDLVLIGAMPPDQKLVFIHDFVNFALFRFSQSFQVPKPPRHIALQLTKVDFDTAQLAI